ncbi:hypothetical protein [Brevundimonas sp.]|uniref:hypothetical protein n=1 Tax=Brevundimonas sp. TaxID=1871086 RepID=UPI00289B7E35|nr:hypothetical protein [Brevundimonas sp.]
MKAVGIVSGLAVLAALTAGGAAQAETLSVNTTVAPYCGIRLANVSSGTASVAHEAEQMVANLELACNTGGTAQLVVNPLNGDFKNGNNLINYAMRLDAVENAFDINTTDATPGDAEGSGKFTRNKVGYSQSLANGSSAQFYLNVNVAAPGPAPLGQTFYPANAAPAGTYNESFSFELSAI